MSFEASEYQKDIFSFVENGKGNALVDAVAGSGKSTTLIKSIGRIPEDKSILFLAFNKSIVEELSNKTAFFPNVTVKTLHSLGVSILNSIFPRTIKADKYKDYFYDGLNSGYFSPGHNLDAEELYTYKKNILKLIDLVRLELCSDVSQFKDIAKKHRIDIISNEFEVVIKTVRWGYKVQKDIDFTDMIYFPVMKKLTVNTYDWVFIDECQDLNAAQREFFLKCVRPETGRFMAVGDPRQAIYGFAGADAESFDKLKKIPDTKLMPLSVCYRCPQSVVALAKELVPQIETFKGAKPGTIHHTDSVDSVRDGDMVLCRVTAPLAKLCISYISHDIKAYIRGKDIGLNLINLIRETNKKKFKDALKSLGKKLNKIAVKHSDRLKCPLSESYESSEYKSLEDKIEAVSALGYGLGNSQQVMNRISSIFSNDDKDGICLSTIHKSKGLEADRVFILAPELLYLENCMGVDWMAEQEKNLVYVAYTRAKKYLGFIKDFKY